jgi:hypothetical protein
MVLEMISLEDEVSLIVALQTKEFANHQPNTPPYEDNPLEPPSSTFPTSILDHELEANRLWQLAVHFSE